MKKETIAMKDVATETINIYKQLNISSVLYPDRKFFIRPEVWFLIALIGYVVLVSAGITYSLVGVEIVLFDAWIPTLIILAGIFPIGILFNWRMRRMMVKSNIPQRPYKHGFEHWARVGYWEYRLQSLLDRLEKGDILTGTKTDLILIPTIIERLQPDTPLWKATIGHKLIFWAITFIVSGLGSWVLGADTEPEIFSRLEIAGKFIFLVVAVLFLGWVFLQFIEWFYNRDFIRNKKMIEDLQTVLYALQKKYN